MKKIDTKTLMRGFVVLTALSVLAVSGTSVFADENGGAKDSKATISFTGKTTSTDPLDPVDPDNPDPEVDPGTGMNGPLSLDVIPTLTFGEHEITGNIETYKSTNLKPYLQVTDTRGTAAGWNVSAQLTDFTSGDDTLSDAMIILESGLVKTTSSNTAGKPTAVQNVVLEAGKTEAVNVMTAGENEGMGTWLNTWLSSNAENEKVTLKVNTSDAKKASYEATLNWTLSVAP